MKGRVPVRLHVVNTPLRPQGVLDLETDCCAFMSVPKEMPSRSMVHGLG